MMAWYSVVWKLAEVVLPLGIVWLMM